MYKTVKTQTNLPVKICHLKVDNNNNNNNYGFSAYIQVITKKNRTI